MQGLPPSLWPGNEASKAWEVEVEVVGREKADVGWGEGNKARNRVRNEERRGGGGWRRERWEG